MLCNIPPLDSALVEYYHKKMIFPAVLVKQMKFSTICGAKVATNIYALRKYNNRVLQCFFLKKKTETSARISHNTEMYNMDMKYSTGPKKNSRYIRTFQNKHRLGSAHIICFDRVVPQCNHTIRNVISMLRFMRVTEKIWLLCRVSHFQPLKI